MSQRPCQSPVMVDTAPALIGMLDQHHATSRLLESRPIDQHTSSEQLSSKDSSWTIALAHQRSYSDDDDVGGEVRALNSTTLTPDDNENRVSKAMLWSGLPHYLLIWELLNILFSICFLCVCGIYQVNRYELLKC